MSDLALSSIRAVDMPRLRHDLLAQLNRGSCDPQLARSTLRNDMVREFGRLHRADLFFVSAPMTELAGEAARSLPDFQVQEQDLPSRCGFMFFEGALRDVAVTSDDGGQRDPVYACSWEVMEDQTARVGVRACLYADAGAEWRASSRLGASDRILRDLMKSPLSTPRTDYFWTFNGRKANEPTHPRDVSLAFEALRSVWLLMQQPLGEVAEAEFDHATVKRLRRARVKERPVRVITLRRPRGATSSAAGQEWHHQWIVRGHWRNHWHPKRQVHRPIWIAPHVKGPEGAPMLGGEKVYALKQ